MFTQSFTCTDPKNPKRQSSHPCLLALLGSAQVKAALKTLVKLNPGWLLQMLVNVSYAKFIASSTIKPPPPPLLPSPPLPTYLSLSLSSLSPSFTAATRAEEREMSVRKTY